ncbi:AAA family ATPase [Paenibacillus guangzhouensis]|uniref:AAA family ATPase n=1 Tax=Paenibacillus guangzhouensis TaxID=1473112 RepID=UPI001267654F|nr:AAA family ATPase [Paenibacillus guangzhouensis]
MRIHGLYMNGFGSKHQVHMKLDSNVTVIYGNNEAGKSTLLGFIRAMLYGIPSRTYMSDRYEPAYGGLHGGRLMLQDSEGKEWVIERYDRTSAGNAPIGAAGEGKQQNLSIRVTDAQGQVRFCSQQDLERELLGGLSADLFRSLFAVSLTELQELRTLQSEELSGFLYHAGIGGGRSLMQAERNLTQEMDKLFRPKGRNQDMNKLLLAMDQLEKDIRKSKSYLQSYNEHVLMLDRADAEIADLASRLESSRAELSLMMRAKGMREQWQRARIIERELAELPVFAAFPEDAVNRTQQLTIERDALELQMQQTDRTMLKLQEEMSGLVFDDERLHDLPEAERLLHMAESMDAKRLEYREIQSEYDAAERELKRLLRMINSSWTLEQLRKFAPTIELRERVRTERERQQASDRRIEGLHADNVRLGRQFEAASADVYTAQQQLDAHQDLGGRQYSHLRSTSMEEAQRLWTKLQHDVQKWHQMFLSWRTVQAQREAEEQAQEHSSQQLRALQAKIRMGALLLTITIPLFFVIAQQWPFAIGSFVMLLILDGYLLFSMQGGSKQARRHARGRLRPGNMASSGLDSDTEIRNHGMNILTMIQAFIAAPTDRTSQVASESTTILDLEQHIEHQMDKLQKSVEPWLQWIQEKKHLTERYQEYLRVEQRLRDQLVETEEVMEQKLEEEEGHRRSWSAWLTSLGLPISLSPDAVLEVLQWSEQGMALLQQMDRLQLKGRDISDQFIAYDVSIAALIEESAQHRTEERMYALRSYKQRLDGYAEAKWLWRQKKDQLAELTSMREDLVYRTDQLDQKLRFLFEEAGAEDEEGLRRHVKLVERREHLLTTHRDLSDQLGGGVEQHPAELVELLTIDDPVRLDQRMQDAEERMKQDEVIYLEKQEQRGRLLHELDAIRQRSEHADTLQRLEEQRAELRSITEEYAVYAICNTLLRRTRRIYEDEKQPQVLRLASQYFAEMTEGKYVKVIAPLGERRMLVEQAQGKLIDSALLSRGTAEQLYLAMRFALAETFASRPHMPLLLDDLFVNFDAGRLDRTLRILKSLAGRHQLILMTCHAHIVDAVKRHFPYADIQRMESEQANLSFL